MLLAPLVTGRKGEYKSIFEDMRRSGYVRVRVDGKIYDLSDEIDLDKQKKHTIEVVVDRLVIRKGQEGRKEGSQEGRNESRSYQKVAERPALYDVNAERELQSGDDGDRVEQAAIRQEQIDASFRQRVTESLETTLKLGSGVVLVSIIDGEEILFSENFACVYDGISLPEIAPRTFSFNSPHGACPTCTGLGTLQVFDPELNRVVPEMVQRSVQAFSRPNNRSSGMRAL